MNFPYETEKSYLYGGNCLIMEVNPSVPDKPISKKSRIFASDYQSLKKDSNRISIPFAKADVPFSSIIKNILYYAMITATLYLPNRMRVPRSNLHCKRLSTCYNKWRPNIKRSLNAKPPIQRSIFSSTFPQKVKSGESWEKPHASSRTTGTSFAS